MSGKPVKHADLPFRPCVGIMVLNNQNKVWVGHRIAKPDSEYSIDAKLWQMPQGGIDQGEDPHNAALRELYEETGMNSVTLLHEAPDWISYDLPDALVGIAFKGRYRGQSQRWFAFRFTGNESEIRINPTPGNEKPEFDRWDWIDMHSLPNMAVEFKRPLYEAVVKEFRHLADD